MKVILFLSFLIIGCFSFKFDPSIPTYTDEPIIGILGIPLYDSPGGCDVLTEKSLKQKESLISFLKSNKNVKETPNSCFTSYYVSWLESAGARVVPLRYNLTEEEIDFFFSRLNGILFTGGGLNLSYNETYVKTALSFFTRAQKDFFPIWGTCQGFQLLSILAANNVSVLESGFDSEDLSLPLELTNDAQNSYLFSSLSSSVKDILTNKNVTMNLHVDGVPPLFYQTNPNLSKFFDLLSFNKDRKGRSFGSTMEAKEYPIFASQWHPERVVFEFNPQLVNLHHTFDAVKANQAMAQFFVNVTRYSKHRFENETVSQKYLIYNYNPYYVGESTRIFYF